MTIVPSRRSVVCVGCERGTKATEPFGSSEHVDHAATIAPGLKPTENLRAFDVGSMVGSNQNSFVAPFFLLNSFLRGDEAFGLWSVQIMRCQLFIGVVSAQVNY